MAQHILFLPTDIFQFQQPQPQPGTIGTPGHVVADGIGGGAVEVTQVVCDPGVQVPGENDVVATAGGVQAGAQTGAQTGLQTGAQTGGGQQE